MGGAGAGGGGWGGGHFTGGGKGPGSRWWAASEMQKASAEMLKEKGLEVPEVSKPWNWLSFFVGLGLGLFIGLIFWELT